MNANIIAYALLGLLPVLCFLAALVYLDSYKLVDIRYVVGAIAAGCLAVVASYPINTTILGTGSIEFVPYTRYVAPFIEETFKGLIFVFLIMRNRVGFLVDAAIFGFAIGAGFAILENLYFLQLRPDTHLGTWLVRGFGTAIMHGGATAMFAVTSRALLRRSRSMGSLVPGYIIAVIVHSTFNHFFFSPIQTTLGFLIFLPVVASVTFKQSEKSVQQWLGSGFDADTELLHLINSGEFSSSNTGKYMHSLKERFQGPVVADMLCYLRLNVELSMRAKGLLMMRENGFDEPVGEETKAKLEELKYLEGSIGTTGKLAMKPLLRMSRKDLWQIYMLSSQ